MWFSRVLSGIWYYLQVVGIYLSFPFGAPGALIIWMLVALLGTVVADRKDYTGQV